LSVPGGLLGVDVSDTAEEIDLRWVETDGST
jgi:hypothetical protein